MANLWTERLLGSRSYKGKASNRDSAATGLPVAARENPGAGFA